MELIKIRMMDSGPNGNYEPRQVIVVDKNRADILISGGHAEPQGEVIEDGIETNNSTSKRTGKSGRGKASPKA